ncbi:hypothetical protein CR513_39694, partial [Mucuna pruriens]
MFHSMIMTLKLSMFSKSLCKKSHIFMDELKAKPFYYIQMEEMRSLRTRYENINSHKWNMEKEKSQNIIQQKEKKEGERRDLCKDQHQENLIKSDFRKITKDKDLANSRAKDKSKGQS